MVEVAITLGLVVSLFAYEAFGLAAGGLVVPGYLALQFGAPGKLLGVMITALLTAGLIKWVSRWTFVFGRRQLVLCVLVGCVLSIASRNLLALDIGLATAELQAVGWVIPGLIANWFLKQGVVRTTCSVIIAATVVRLAVIVIFGGALLPT